MTVIYPTVLGGSNPPGAITLDRKTYSIDRESGVIDCPPEREQAVAEHLADRYGVDLADILERDEPPDDATIPDHTRGDDDDADETPAVDEMTYEELYAKAKERDLDGRSSMSTDELRDELREE